MAQPYTATLTQRTRKGDWLDYTGDVADLVLDQVKEIRQYIPIVYVVKLASKVVQRVHYSLRSPNPAYDLIVQPPISIPEAIKLVRILNQWFPAIDEFGMFVVLMTPMWARDP